MTPDHPHDKKDKLTSNMRGVMPYRQITKTFPHPPQKHPVSRHPSPPPLYHPYLHLHHRLNKQEPPSSVERGVMPYKTQK